MKKNTVTAGSTWQQMRDILPQFGDWKTESALLMPKLEVRTLHHISGL